MVTIHVEPDVRQGRIPRSHTVQFAAAGPQQDAASMFKVYQAIMQMSSEIGREDVNMTYADTLAMMSRGSAGNIAD
jgi:hypothetical protein